MTNGLPVLPVPTRVVAGSRWPNSVEYQPRGGSSSPRCAVHDSSAGSSSTGYTGTFQEYNTTVYHTQLNAAIPRRDANRIVRAINTGDLFWTNDHYSTFHYMGRH